MGLLFSDGTRPRRRIVTCDTTESPVIARLDPPKAAGLMIGDGVNPFDGGQLAALAARVEDGDAAAEETLVVLFEPRIWTLLLARLRDREAARELLADVLLAVLQALRARKLREGERLAA